VSGRAFTFAEGSAIARKHAQNPELGSPCDGVLLRSGRAKESLNKNNKDWRTKFVVSVAKVDASTLGGLATL
jgi:hypothetical protein